MALALLRRIGLVGCGAIALLAAGWFGLAGDAPAATQIGQTFAPPGTVLCSEVVVVQAASTAPEPSYAAAAAGVVTKMSHEAASDTGRSAALMVLRESGSGFVVVGSTGVQSLNPSVLNQFATRIPIRAGDRIGMFVATPTTKCGRAATASDTVRFDNPVSSLPADGATLPLATSTPGGVLDVAAQIEPDADGDGFGDETQDECPADATKQTHCDTRAPLIVLEGKRKQSLRRGKVKVTVEADENAVASATATMAVPSTAARAYSLKPAGATLVAHVKKTLTLKIPKKARRAARSGLRRGHVLVRVTVRLSDASGNTSQAARTIRLKR